MLSFEVTVEDDGGEVRPRWWGPEDGPKLERSYTVIVGTERSAHVGESEVPDVVAAVLRRFLSIVNT